MLNFDSLGQTARPGLWRSAGNPFDPPFKVTQGHQNWHRPIDYLWLQVWAYLIPFPR